MADILGPADAPNSVTARPSDTRTFFSQDSWFRDCSDPLADDGTDLQAGFLNGVIAPLRSLWRVNGKLIDNVTSVVPEVGADDDGLTKSMQHLVQRGQTLYANDVGATNAFVVSLSPAALEYKAGLTLRFKVNNTITAAPTLNVNGLGARNVTHLDGSPPVRGELRSGMILEVAYDGAAWQLISFAFSLPVPLTTNATYFVDPNLGNDANDGLATGAGRAFKTIQRAVDVASSFNLNGYNVTINCAGGSGTYTNTTLRRFTGAGSKIFIIGDVNVPANCHVACAVGTAFSYGGSLPVTGYEVWGFKVSSGGVNPVTGEGSHGFYGVGAGSQIYIKNIEFGSVQGCHMAVDLGGQLGIRGVGTGDAGAFVRVSGNAGACHMQAADTAVLTVAQPALVVTGSVNIGTWAVSVILGAINGSYSSQSIGGTVTGYKYSVSLNSVIYVNGAGVNHFPGTIAGIAATGGQYA